jgi:class 3 adenylate cyclase
MADINKMNRTWLCSVLFMDIVNYSSQSVELQIKWKDRFNGYLANAIKDVPEDERVILDTGDGAATCFLGAPEVAMFSALELWHSLLLDEREQQPQLRVRIGINLGPVKLVRDINGAPNAIGDGMNAGQRIMSFAGENQILVSQSYFEVVSRLSDDYKTLFTLKGVETDKHIREHTVYHLSPPGAQHSPVSLVTPQPAVPLPAAASHHSSASPETVAPKIAEVAPESHPGTKARRNLAIPLLVGGIALVVVAAAVAWHFTGSAAPAKPSGQISVTSPAPVPSVVPSAVQSATAPSAPAPPAQSAAAPSAPAPSPVSPTPLVTASGNPRPKQAVVSTRVKSVAEQAPQARPVEAPAATISPASQEVSNADQATARDLRDRYNMDAGRAATARSNAEVIRQRLAAKGMSLNAQTAAALDNLKVLLDEAAEALRDHKWDDALSSLQAVESETQKINRTVGN